MIKSLILAMAALALLAPSTEAASIYCDAPEDGAHPYGFFGEHDTKQWREKRCKTQEQGTEAQRRDAVTNERRKEAELRREIDCVVYGTCPSTSQDLRDQLKRQK